MNRLLALLTLTVVVVVLPVGSATLSQAILYTTDTTGTNARPSAITISPSTDGTNLAAGAITVTNNLHVVNQVVVDSLQDDELVLAGGGHVLSSLSPGNAGDLLTSGGAGVAPSFVIPIWTTNVDGTIEATSEASGSIPALSVNSNRFQIGDDGSLYIGDDTLSWWGGTGGSTLVSHYGINEFFTLYLDNSGDGSQPYTSIELRSNGGVSDSGVVATYHHDSLNDSGRLMADSGGVRLFLIVDDTTRVNLTPDNPDGSTPFLFDTSVAHTTSNLLEVKNHADSTKQVNVTYDGSLQTAVPTGATNAQPFKVGDIATGTVSLTTTGYVQVEINGTLVKLGIVK